MPRSYGRSGSNRPLFDFTPQHQVRGGSELADISRKLRKVGDGKQIKKQMSKDLRAAAKPLVPAVRASIKAIPTTGKKHTGLRQNMVKATHLVIRTRGRDAGISVLVDGRRMPDGQKALPAYMEGTIPRWRHPVFDEDRWVTQKSRPYFYKVVNRYGKKARKTVNHTLDEITKKIT